MKVVITQPRKEFNASGNLTLVRQDLNLRDRRQALEKLDTNFLGIFTETCCLPAFCQWRMKVQLNNAVIGVLARSKDNLET